MTNGNLFMGFVYGCVAWGLITVVLGVLAEVLS